MTAGQVMGSLIMFALIYALLFVLFIYLLDQKIRTGPVDDELPLKPKSLKGQRA